MHVFLSVETEPRGMVIHAIVQTLQKSNVGNACVPKCGEGATRGEGGVCELVQTLQKST